MANFTGTKYSDVIIGVQSESNVFSGYGIGQDAVIGGQHDDTFFLAVDQLKDTINGGSGGFHDEIDYSAADRGVIVDLAAGHAWATWFQPTSVSLPASNLGSN